MLLSYWDEYPCECKKLYSRPVANIWRMGLRMQFATNSQCSQSDRQTFVVIAGVRKHSRSLVWSCEYYATLTLFRISLRMYEAYDQFAEFLVNPLRMLRILTNVLRLIQMPCHQ